MGNVPSAADIVYRKIKKQIFSKGSVTTNG